MTSRRPPKRRDGKKPRPYVHEKKAFSEDADCDPTLSGVEKAILAVIVKSYNNHEGWSECAYTFLARGAGTTKKVAIRYMRQLVDKGRVFPIIKGTGRASSRWGVNWKFRGSAMVREVNGGEAIADCRGPQDVTSRGPQNVTPPSVTLGTSEPRRGPQAGTQTPFIPLRGNKRPTDGAAAVPLRAAAPAVAKSYVATVIEAMVEDGSTLWLDMEAMDGRSLMLDFVIDCPDAAAREAGLNSLRIFCAAAGVREDLDDPSELIGARVRIDGYSTRNVRVTSAPANDHQDLEDAA